MVFWPWGLRLASLLLAMVALGGNAASIRLLSPPDGATIMGNQLLLFVDLSGLGQPLGSGHGGGALCVFVREAPAFQMCYTDYGLGNEKERVFIKVSCQKP
jgi:hypothetical protein